MGEAKRRGTFKERKSSAIKRRLEIINEQKIFTATKQLSGCQKTMQFLTAVSVISAMGQSPSQQEVFNLRNK